MLTRVQIKNFRLCENVVLDALGQVTALVGHNGVGKSNTLQAIADAAAAAVSTVDTLGPIDSIGGRFKPVEITIDFELSRTHFRYQRNVTDGGTQRSGATLTEHLHVKKHGETDLRLILARNGSTVNISGLQGPLAIGEMASSIGLVRTMFPPSEPLVADIRVAADFFSRIRYYPLESHSLSSGVAGVVPDNEYSKWVAKHESGAYSDDTVMKILHLHKTNQKEFNTLSELLGPRGLKLIQSIMVYEYKSPSQKPDDEKKVEFHILQFRPLIGGDEFVYVPFSNLSAGTRRIVALLVALVFDDSSLMLIEQPEDGLHQGMTKKLIGLLKQNALKAQLLMSSHSSVLLDTLTPEEIRLVSLKNGHTQIRRFTHGELENAHEYMREFGPLSAFIQTISSADK